LRQSVTTQNFTFLSYWYRKKRLQMHFQQVFCHNAICKTRRWRAVVSSLRSENYSTSKSLYVSPEKSQILSCDTVVTYERYDLSYFDLLEDGIYILFLSFVSDCHFLSVKMDIHGLRWNIWMFLSLFLQTLLRRCRTEACAEFFVQ